MVFYRTRIFGPNTILVFWKCSFWTTKWHQHKRSSKINFSYFTITTKFQSDILKKTFHKYLPVMLRRNERTKQNEKRSLAFPKSILSLAISTWSAQHSSPMHGCAITRRSSKRRHQALDRSEHSTRDVSSDIIIVRLLGLLHSSLCNVVRRRRNEQKKKRKERKKIWEIS